MKKEEKREYFYVGFGFGVINLEVDLVESSLCFKLALNMMNLYCM